jgi:hypothetical protein
MYLLEVYYSILLMTFLMKNYVFSLSDRYTAVVYMWKLLSL